jgi:hypothetical protein
MAIKHLPYPGQSDLDPSLGQITDFRALNNSITNAQVLALHTTPITLVPAFDTLNLSVLIADELKVQYVAGGTAFTIGGGVLNVQYTGSGGLVAVTISPTGWLDQTTSGTKYGLNVNVANGHLPTPSAPLVLFETVANLTLGTGTIITDTRYRIEPVIIH